MNSKAPQHQSLLILKFSLAHPCLNNINRSRSSSGNSNSINVSNYNIININGII